MVFFFLFFKIYSIAINSKSRSLTYFLKVKKKHYHDTCKSLTLSRWFSLRVFLCKYSNFISIVCDSVKNHSKTGQNLTETVPYNIIMSIFSRILLFNFKISLINDFVFWSHKIPLYVTWEMYHIVKICNLRWTFLHTELFSFAVFMWLFKNSDFHKYFIWDFCIFNLKYYSTIYENVIAFKILLHSFLNPLFKDRENKWIVQTKHRPVFRPQASINTILGLNCSAVCLSDWRFDYWPAI